MDFPTSPFQVRFLYPSREGSSNDWKLISPLLLSSPVLALGIFTEPQAEAWREVTKAAHDKVGPSHFEQNGEKGRSRTEIVERCSLSSLVQGAIIFAQIFAMGRANTGQVTEAVAPSPIPLKGSTVIPRELTLEEITRELGSGTSLVLISSD